MNYYLKPKNIQTMFYKLVGLILLSIVYCTSLSGQWIQQGPGPSHRGQIEGIANRPVTGAVNCVTPHPTNSNVLYVGAVNGGVWKSVNANATVPNWICISDDISSQAIGALELDPTDASNLTLVVGNGYTSSFGSSGSGRRSIFKTSNGAGPWTNIDPNNRLPVEDFTGLAPRGDDIVAGLNSSGIYRTTDNGDDWTLLSNNTVGLPIGGSWDLVSDPIDNSILYTVIEDEGIYKTVNSGLTWDKVSDARIDGQFDSAINANLAVGDANNVFVSIVTEEKLSGVFRSGNGGISWDSLDLPLTVEDGDTIGLFYRSPNDKHLSFAADPSNDNVVYIGGKAQPGPRDPNSVGASDATGRLFRINAGLAPGNQVSPITHNGTANISAPHADSRDMDFNANGDLLQCDDGGVYRQSSPANNNGDWFSINGNLSVSESHSADWDALSKVGIVGQQDNGVTEQSNLGNTTWSNVKRGDGGDVAAGTLSSNVSVRYSSTQYLGGFIKREYNAGGSFQSGSQMNVSLTNTSNGEDLFDTDEFAFVAPICLSSQNGRRLLVASDSALYESLDQGSTVDLVLDERINGARATSNSLARRDVMTYGANDNPEVIYAGVGNDLHVRTIAGANFLEASGYSGGWITGVTLNPYNSQAAYVISSSSVYETTNGGAAFDGITGNLTALGAGSLLSIVYIPNGTGDMLAVGTTTGVYIAAGPDFNTWAELSPNLPNVRIEELIYNENDQILVAATFGRGLWTYSFDERDPVDISLVLDFSGSMMFSPCIACQPKITVLKKAVEIFLQIWRTLAVGDDIVNTIYFRTDVTDFRYDGTNNLDVIDRTDDIIAHVNSQTTDFGEKTAMGGGLQLGINELSNTNRPRHVILFTDGVQNVDPGLRFPQLDIVNNQYPDDSNVNPTSPATNLNNLDSLRIHTIGVGAGPAFVSQLSDISDATDGLTKITIAPDDDLIQFYIEQLVEVLRDYSPQLITYRKNGLSGLKKESVDINNSASQVLFKVSYPAGKQIGVKIKKGGTNVTHLANRIEGDFYDIYHFPFDKLAQARGMNSSSSWEVTLSSGGPQLKYQLAVLADEKVLDYDLGVIGTGIISGTPTKLFVTVNKPGINYIKDAVITGTIKYPRKPIGNLLSNYKLPQNGKLKFEKGATIGERKYAYLMRDKKYISFLKPRTAEIKFKRDKSGKYNAVFKNTKIAGTYCVEFLIKGKDEEVGYFERVETRNFVIHFGKLNRKASKIQIKNTSGEKWSLVIRPIDINGNLLGPDQLSNLDLSVKNGKVVDRKDNGDGSYEFIFNGIKNKSTLQLKYKDIIWMKSGKLK